MKAFEPAVVGVTAGLGASKVLHAGFLVSVPTVVSGLKKLWTRCALLGWTGFDGTIQIL
jgi:hypothetical protein